MVHEIVRSIITITEELEYIPTLQILVNQINCAAHKCIMKVTLKFLTYAYSSKKYK